MTSDEIRKINVGLEDSANEILRELTAQIARANELRERDIWVTQKREEGQIPGTHLYSISYRVKFLRYERLIRAHSAADALSMFHSHQVALGSPVSDLIISIARDQSAEEGIMAL